MKTISVVEKIEYLDELESQYKHLGKESFQMMAINYLKSRNSISFKHNCTCGGINRGMSHMDYCPQLKEVLGAL